MMARINSFGFQGTPQTVFPTNWVSEGNNLPGYVVTDTNSNDWDWEEYTSVSIDPSDDLTFWGTGQYLPNQNQNQCCYWDTQVFLCQAGASGTDMYCP